MTVQQRRFRPPRIRSNSESRSFHWHVAKGIQIVLGVAVAATIFVPVEIVAAGLCPSHPLVVAATIDSLRTGVVAGAGLSCVFLMTVPVWHWIERLIIGAGGLVAVAFATFVLAVDPIRTSRFEASPGLLPFAPLVVWAIATPMLAARVWGNMRFGAPIAGWESASRPASTAGMLVYLTITAVAIGAMPVRDVMTWEHVVFISFYSMGVGAILVSYTFVLLHGPLRVQWMTVASFVLLLLLATASQTVGNRPTSGVVCSATAAALFYALFVLAFRLERTPSQSV